MLISTRPRRTIAPSPPPRDPPIMPASPGVIADALLREHTEASAMLGSTPLAAWSDLAAVARELSREARDVARSLLGDRSVAPPVVAGAPPVVLTRDLAVAQRGLRSALATSPTRAQCAMLLESLARVADLRDVVGAALEVIPAR